MKNGEETVGYAAIAAARFDRVLNETRGHAAHLTIEPILGVLLHPQPKNIQNAEQISTTIKGGGGGEHL